MDNNQTQTDEATVEPVIELTEIAPSVGPGVAHDTVVINPDGEQERIVVEEDGSWHKEPLNG